MTPMSDDQRRRLARPVRLMYWLILIAGLALFTTTRHGEPEVTAALWVGTIAGTLLGQHCALHDYRLWISALVFAAVGLYCAPLVSIGSASLQVWLSFIPAALCGFWSLGDRSALAALWFPIVLWMLTILDHSDRIAPDGPAATLLGGLAGMVLCFLCLRESRRVALWRSTAAEPLAPALPTELLREPPGRQLARAGWWLTVGALTVAITVWLVPPLWQRETLGGPPTPLAAATPTPIRTGLPCCPVHGDADTLSSRVKEYLDLGLGMGLGTGLGMGLGMGPGIGLGHGASTAAPREGIDCRRCSAPVPGAIATPGGGVIAWSGRRRAPGTGTVIDLSGEPGTAWPSPSPVRSGRAAAPGRTRVLPSAAPASPGSPVPVPPDDLDASAGSPAGSVLPSPRDPWAAGDAAPSSPAAPSPIATASRPGDAAAPSDAPLGSTARRWTADPASTTPAPGRPAEPSQATPASRDPWSAGPQAEPVAATPPPIPDPQHPAADPPARAPLPSQHEWELAASGRGWRSARCGQHPVLVVDSLSRGV